MGKGETNPTKEDRQGFRGELDVIEQARMERSAQRENKKRELGQRAEVLRVKIEEARQEAQEAQDAIAQTEEMLKKGFSDEEKEKIFEIQGEADKALQTFQELRVEFAAVEQAIKQLEAKGAEEEQPRETITKEQLQMKQGFIKKGKEFLYKEEFQKLLADLKDSGLPSHEIEDVAAQLLTHLAYIKQTRAEEITTQIPLPEIKRQEAMEKGVVNFLETLVPTSTVGVIRVTVPNFGREGGNRRGNRNALFLEAKGLDHEDFLEFAQREQLFRSLEVRDKVQNMIQKISGMLRGEHYKGPESIYKIEDDGAGRTLDSLKKIWEWMKMKE